MFLNLSQERLSRIFVAFLGESNVMYLRSQIDQDFVSSNQDQSGQVVLLSAEILSTSEMEGFLSETLFLQVQMTRYGTLHRLLHHTNRIG